MKHFSSEEWADYVRDRSPEAERAEMRAHLETGCSRCRRTAATLAEVAHLGALESTFEVPSEILARAQSVFKTTRPNDWVDRLQAVVAELVFETFGGLQPEGVRTLESDSNRLQYRAGDYAIDLKIERLGAEDSCGIIGQIANERDTNENVSGAVVQIVSAGRSVGEAETNQFGEFMIEQPRSRSAVLRIALRAQGHRIEVPLKNLRRSADQR